MSTILDRETINIAHEEQSLFVSFSDGLVLPPVRIGIMGAQGSHRAFLSLDEARALVAKLDAAITAATPTEAAA